VNEWQRLEEESSPDSFQGMTWAERARFGVLGAVLDPADKSGRKNAFIDRVQRTALQRTLGRRHFNRALDFGCGTGRLLRLLAARSNQVYALDRTLEMLDIARQQLELPNEHFVHWNEPRLSFGDGFFDLIISVGVLCTVSRVEFHRITGELRRVCSEGGIIILLEQVDNARSLTPATYVGAFPGFECISANPVRASASRLMTYASNPNVPSWLIGPLAGLELMRLQGVRFQPNTRGYWDYLFVLKKAAK
jgi:SAM-dependent methyltransferase